MASYAKSTNNQATQHGNTASGGYDVPPDPGPIVADHMRLWLVKRKQHRLPAPAPEQPADAAAWWMRNMQEPEQQGETRQVPVAGGDSNRWELGYANRCAFAFLRWADMSQLERDFVCNGVMGDAVPYRGDTFAAFRDIYDQTINMRTVGKSAYLRKNRRGIDGYMARLCSKKIDALHRG